MITNNDVYAYRVALQQLYGVKNWEIESRLLIFASNVNDDRINGYSMDPSRHVISVSVRKTADAVSLFAEAADIIRGYINENASMLAAFLPANYSQETFAEFLSNNNLIADLNIIGTKITISL